MFLYSVFHYLSWGMKKGNVKISLPKTNYCINCLKKFAVKSALGSREDAKKTPITQKLATDTHRHPQTKIKDPQPMSFQPQAAHKPVRVSPCGSVAKKNSVERSNSAASFSDQPPAILPHSKILGLFCQFPPLPGGGARVRRFGHGDLEHGSQSVGGLFSKA